MSFFVRFFKGTLWGAMKSQSPQATAVNRCAGYSLAIGTYM